MNSQQTTDRRPQKKYSAWLYLLLAVYYSPLASQQITHGPVVGAVTSSGCKIYFRTGSPAEVKIELSDAQTFSGFTIKERDNSIILPVHSLLPDKKYSFKIFVNGKQDVVEGSFKTFPAE